MVTMMIPLMSKSGAAASVPHQLGLSDLVSAFPTYDSCGEQQPEDCGNSSRWLLVSGSRPWRSGVRTHIMANINEERAEELSARFSNLLESYQSLPDSDFVFEKQRSKPGHVRCALAPFYAHQHFMAAGHDYKWMLYGA